MAMSLLSSLFIAYLYVHFYSNRATGSQVHRAFPLLGISITAIFVTIQFSLPLSLGLLGALSIVRFRTPIKEPEEIGFIMLVIAASIATATFKLAFVGIMFVVALVALVRSGLVGAACRRNAMRRDDRDLAAPERHGRRRWRRHRRRCCASGCRSATLESISQTDRETVDAYQLPGRRRASRCSAAERAAPPSSTRPTTCSSIVPWRL